MRVGIDCRMYSSSFTGIGRYVFELTENLFKIDHDNEYVLFFNSAEYRKFCLSEHTKNAPNAPKVEKVLVNAPHYSFKEQTRFLSALNKAKLDLMHFTHFNAPIFYNKPFVVTIHDLTLNYFPGKKMNNPLRRAAYKITLKHAVKKACAIITVSRNTKTDLRLLLKTPSDKIKVIYEGVHEKFKPLNNRQAVRAIKNKYNLDKPYLLYTGVWRGHKNLPALLQAFYILKTKYGFDGYLVITGRKDPLYAPDIMQAITLLQLKKDVIFTGLVKEDELVPLYNGALTYVFPSLYEGFGLPPLEAMRCGVPVVASSSSCIPEVCGKGNAIYFDPYSPDDMAEKIFSVISQKSLREKLIARGLKHVKKYSWERMARQTLAVYSGARC
jgi:glycosyltransferase involved in cell wall biosynthesis